MIVNTLKQVLLAINLVVHPVARTIAAASLPSRNILQQTISTTVMADKKEKVPGDNFAYYCGPTPSSEQLFEIEEYDIAPNPPVVDHRMFGYLGGFMPNEPDLNEASFRMALSKEGGPSTSVERKFVDCKWILMRHSHLEFGYEIKPGQMEFVVDYLPLALGFAPGNYTFTAESRLPDGRVLFAIEFTVPMNQGN